MCCIKSYSSVAKIKIPTLVNRSTKDKIRFNTGSATTAQLAVVGEIAYVEDKFLLIQVLRPLLPWDALVTNVGLFPSVKRQERKAITSISHFSMRFQGVKFNHR